MEDNSKSLLADQFPVFDPRKISTDAGHQRQVWTTQSVELYKEGLRNGDELTASPFNKRIKGFNLRQANLPFYANDDEIELMMMAMEDKVLFSNNFIELKDPEKGEWTSVTLRPYQENLLYDYDKHRWHILKFPRQSGKTTTTICEIVHFLTFNIDKDVVVAAQSDNVVTEIFQKIKSAFSALPFYMQPGVIKFSDSDGTLELDNGCRLKIGIASESVFQGFTLDFVFIDEFAYIPDSRVNKFWMNLYPALQANPNSRCIIASTPNGRNKFYEMWQASVKGRNTFHRSHIHWTDVPRSIPLDQFKQETINNITLEGWLMGYECSFDTQLKSIFSTKIQLKLRTEQNIVEKNPDDYWSYDYDSLGTLHNIKFLNKDKFMYDVKNDYFLMGIDIGEGLDADYSVIKIRKAHYDTETSKVKYKLIGVYHDNTTGVSEFAEIVKDLCSEFDQSKIKVIVENNNYGGEFFATIKNKQMTDFKFDFDDFVFAKFFRASKEDYEKGIRWNKENKKTAVKDYKNLISMDIFDDTYPESIDESMNFGKLKNGSYAAQYGHDDLTMTDVTIAHYVKNSTNDNFITDLNYFLKPETIEFGKIQEEIKLNKFQYNVNGFTIKKHKEKNKNNMLFLNRKGNSVVNVKSTKSKFTD